MRRARLLLQLDAALRQQQRLVVAVLHHRHVRLVAADGGHDVAGPDHHREAFGLAQRRHRFVEAPFLGERHAAERMDQGQVALIAGGVQRRRRLRDVLADDGGVADVAVAEAELVVGEADGAGVVGALGLLQRAAEKGDAARGFPLGDRQLAVKAPQLGQASRVQALTLFWRIP